MPGVHFHAAVSVTYEFCSVLDTTSWIFTANLLVSHTLELEELATRQVTLSTCTYMYISVAHFKQVQCTAYSLGMGLMALSGWRRSSSSSNPYRRGFNSIVFAERIDVITYDPLSYFSFQPVLHDWCNKGCGMCYPVCGMVHIKDPLLLIDKSSLCGGNGFPFSLSEWSLTICLTPYNRR